MAKKFMFHQFFIAFTAFTLVQYCGADNKTTLNVKKLQKRIRKQC